MLIYLAHPIDKRTNKLKDELDRRLDYIRHSIKATGHHLYHPGQAFVVGGKTEPDWTIEHINRTAQNTADGLLVVWPKGSKSWGVPAEIERARIIGQPVAIITDDKPTWAMPNPEADPLVKIFSMDSGNNIKAIQWLEKHHTPQRRENNTVKWTRTEEAGQSPRRAYEDDAGFDLYISRETTIPPGKFADVHTDVAIELPSDAWGMLTGRSSTLRKKGLLVNQGIIDPGYRGELYIGCWNMTNNPVTVYPGERIGQIIILPNMTAMLSLVETDQLSHHPRGTKGFGSTGE
jgi:dUTP pyrophosphatase